jgi:hypothetical protein
MKGNTERGALDILEYMSANNITNDILHDLPSLLSGGPEVEILKANGADILKFLAQDKISSMIDSISASHSLRTSSASNLLKIVGTLLMTIVAHEVESRHLNASGLKEMLQSHVDYVKKSPEHGINEIVGPWSNVFPSRVAHGVMQVENEEPADNRSMMSKLLPWIILLIAALGLFYFLEKGSAL